MPEATPIKRIFQITTIDEIINRWPPDAADPWYSVFAGHNKDIDKAYECDEDMRDAAYVDDWVTWRRLADDRAVSISDFRDEYGEEECQISWSPGTLWESRLIEDSFLWKWMDEEPE